MWQKVCLNNFRKNWINETNIFSRECNSLTKDNKLLKCKVKLTNRQLTKLRSAEKSKTGITLVIVKKNFQSEELPPEMLMTVRQRK